MKLQLSLILLSALLATASAKEGYHAYKETEAGPAFIRKSINYKVVDAGVSLSDDMAGEIFYHINEGDYQAGAFFQTEAPGYIPQISSSTLAATQGSIIIQYGVSLNNAELGTKTNNVTDEIWGLPQIVICHSTFANTCMLQSNYCTIEDWQISDGSNNTVISLASSGGTFTEGTVAGSATIETVGPVKFNGLSISAAMGIERIAGHEAQTPDAASEIVDIRNWELSGDGSMMLSNCGGTLANGTVVGKKRITADAAVTLDGLILDDAEDVLHVIGKDDIVITTNGDTSFASEEGDGAGKLLLETCGKVTIGTNPGVGEEIHCLKGNVEISFVDKEADDNYDLNVYCKMEGSLKVAAAGNLNAGILLGTADIQAQRVYLSAFEGGPLNIKVEKSVTVNGNVNAETVNITQTGEKALEEEQYVGITFQGSLVGTDKIELKGQSVTGTEKDALVSSNDCDIEALGDIDIKGKLQVGNNASIRAGGSMYFGGAEALEDSSPEDRLLFSAGSDMQFGGAVNLEHASFSAGSNITFGGTVSLKDASTIAAKEAVAFSKGGTLRETTVSAPWVTIEQGLSASYFELLGGDSDKDCAQVSFNGTLELNASSRIVGDVVGDENPLYAHNVALDHSTITGKLANVDELKLVDSTIGSAEEVDTLSSKGTSLISNQNGTLKVGSLNLEGGNLTVGPRHIIYENKDVEVVEKLAVHANTILNANLLLDDGACVTFATDAVVTLDGYGTITLMGDVDFILLDGQGGPPAYSRLMMDCVEDVLDADGWSVRSIWKQYSDRDVWYAPLYELGTQDGVHYTTNPGAAGATLSQLSLIYDASMAQNQNSTYGRLLIGYVPEPSSSTLCLLALAALAARRPK